MSVHSTSHRQLDVAAPVPAAAVSLIVGTLALGLLTVGSDQRLAALVLGVGLIVTLGGRIARERVGSVFGRLISLLGASIGAYGLYRALTEVATVTARAVLLPGMVGLCILALGLVLSRPVLGRTATVVGSGCLLASIVLAGVTEHTSRPAIVIAAVATVLAWDLADHGISLARQVGARARTARVTVLHSGATAVVGALIGATILGIDRVAVGQLSLQGFLLATAVAVVLLLALRQ